MKKILIVDDNKFIIEIMSYILKSRGYEVSALTTGDAVVENVNKTQPDLVILDDDLPGITGRRVCQMLKFNQSTHSLPVIMCSGSDDIDDSLNQQGAPNDILHKPFDVDALLNKVELQLAA